MQLKGILRGSEGPALEAFNSGDELGFFEFKDGAYYCYRAYVLRISRYSDFLLAVLTSTGIFLHGSKLHGENRT